jgi:hypothetical protein
MHLNIVHPPTSLSSQWSLSFWLSRQYPISIPVTPLACYILCPPRPPWLAHSRYTWRRVQVMQLSTTSCHSITFWPKYSPQYPVLKHSLSTFLPKYQRPSLTAIQNHRQSYSLVQSNFDVFYTKLSCKNECEWIMQIVKLRDKPITCVCWYSENRRVQRLTCISPTQVVTWASNALSKCYKPLRTAYTKYQN